jgi:DNA-binding CsgD family transcriptional regulator
MLDLLSSPAAANVAFAPQHYVGPERRSSASRLITRWFAQMLDEIDYGMLLVVDETKVVHANQAAKRYLDGELPLGLAGRELCVRFAHDVAPVRQALANAAQRGLRTLLTLGTEGRRVCVAFVPLAGFGDDPPGATLLVLSKHQVCETLSVQWFARTHRLTLAEARVLQHLCRDLQPRQIALLQRVALSTIRTQIGSIRAKTGAESIRSLVRQVAVLPPLMCALRPTGGDEAA